MINKKELHEIINYDVVAVIEDNLELTKIKAFHLEGHEKLDLGETGVLTSAGFKDGDISKSIPIIAVVHKYNGKNILSWSFYEGCKDYDLVKKWLQYHYPKAIIFDSLQTEDLFRYCEGE